MPSPQFEQNVLIGRSSGLAGKRPAFRLRSFKFWSLTAAATCFLLAAIWFLWPPLLLSIWGLEANVTALVLGRRSAALFLGIGLMFWQARHAPPSPARAALSSGFAIGCLLLAATGVRDWAAGNVGPGIAVALVCELVLAVGIFSSSRDGRMNKTPDDEIAS